MEAYVLSKALTAADHTYQSNLLRNCMHAIKRQSELRHKFKMVLKIKHVTLAVKAIESMKKLVRMNAVSRETKLRAAFKHEQMLKVRALKALCVNQSRESLVRQFRQRSLLNFSRQVLCQWEN